jgi:hypothetical protein
MAHKSIGDDELSGIEAVAEALRAEDFPMDKHALAYAVGDIDVEDGHGGSVPVRNVLDAITQDDFASADLAVRAIRSAARRTPPRRET